MSQSPAKSVVGRRAPVGASKGLTRTTRFKALLRKLHERSCAAGVLRSASECLRSVAFDSIMSNIRDLTEKVNSSVEFVAYK